MRFLIFLFSLLFCHDQLFGLDSSIHKGGIYKRDGYVQWLSDARLNEIRSALPKVESRSLASKLQSQSTMWYDESSMEFTYQDSVETVVGVRANRVGREVGERNRHNPGIATLLNLFGPDKRFMFPFRTAAGTDDCAGVHVANFWNLPTQNGSPLPVKWWKASSRGRWHWVFPVGTTFGEVLMQRSPTGELVVFEIRTRERFLNGWKVDLFRPFAKATELSSAIKNARRDWSSDFSLSNVIEHLEATDNLVPHRLSSVPFANVFRPIDGALDEIPDMNDPALVVELLRNTPFKSVEGKIWKKGEQLETYAPASAADFNIVPGGYKMGLVPVNEVSCNRCHENTGQAIGDFEDKALLYGEIWGEDRIFTWHLFRVHSKIYGTFDDEDGSRQINPALQQAGLLLNQKVQQGDPLHQQLKTPY